MFNLHAAVWSGGREACVAIYNVQYVSRRQTLRRCIFSECFDDEDRQKVRAAIHEVALEVQRQLQEVMRMAGVVVELLWNVIVALVTFIFFVILLPFRSPQYA